MKNVSKPAFTLSDNAAIQGGNVIKPTIKHTASSTFTENEVSNAVSLAISRSKQNANAVQKALALTTLHAQSTGDIRQIGRLINGIAGVVRMQGVLGFLEHYAPVMIETKGKGYLVTYNDNNRWGEHEFANGGLVTEVLTKPYLDFQPDKPENSFDADKVLVQTAIRIAGRIIEPKAGDVLDIERAKVLFDMVYPLANEKQCITIDLARDCIAQDEALIGELENEPTTEQQPLALPAAVNL